MRENFGNTFEAGDKAMVEAVGNELHTIWQKQFRIDNPTEETRIKPTADARWAERHDAAPLGPEEKGYNPEVPKWKVDILNTDFANLPEDWRKDNFEAAEVAVAIVEQHFDQFGETADFGEEFIEKASAEIHEAFLERRKDQYIPESQKMPYAELSEADKALDRNQIQAAIKLWQTGVAR